MSEHPFRDVDVKKTLIYLSQQSHKGWYYLEVLIRATGLSLGFEDVSAPQFWLTGGEYQAFNLRKVVYILRVVQVTWDSLEG